MESPEPTSDVQVKIHPQCISHTTDSHRAQDEATQTWMVYFTAVIAFATVVQAFTTCSQWQAMKQSNELGYRAWLSVKKPQGSISRPIRTNDVIDIGFYVWNTGSSPAQQATATTTVCTFPASYNIPERLRDTSCKSVLPNLGPLGKDDDVFIPFKSLPLPTDIADELAKGTQFMYFIAEISYSDQFSSSRELNFCFFLNMKDPNSGTKGFAPCATHNSMR